MGKLKNKITKMNKGLGRFLSLYLVDLFVLIGLLLIITGVFLVFGIGISLIVAGVLTILFTIIDVHTLWKRS